MRTNPADQARRPLLLVFAVVNATGDTGIPVSPGIVTSWRSGRAGSPRRVGSGGEDALVQFRDDLARRGDRPVLPGVQVAQVVTGEVHVALRLVERCVCRG